MKVNVTFRHMDPDDELRDYVVGKVFPDGVDFRDYFATEIKRLTPLADDDLINLDDAGIQITPKGRLLLRNIAMTFDRYFGNEDNSDRFSKAI